MISMIVAMDDKQAIGFNNQLPWHLPEDLKYFKRVTTGHPIVMGRKTRDSIGRNLPNRENVILTRDKQYACDGCTVLHSIDDFNNWQETMEKEIFIIGGSEIFKETLNITDRLYITEISGEFEADTYFPIIDWNEWHIISEEKGIRNEQNDYDYRFLVYERN